MNERAIVNALNEAARSMTVPPAFRRPSAVVKETAARHRRDRRRIVYGVGTVAAAAAAFLFVLATQKPTQGPQGPNVQQYEPYTALPPNTASNETPGVWADVNVSNSVEDMAAQSTVVVRGVIEKPLGTWNLNRNVANPSMEADQVRPGTDFQVAASHYAKGSGPKTLVLTIPGGTYKGVTEAYQADLQTGKEYVFFVQPHHGPSSFNPEGKQRYGFVSLPGYYAIQNDVAVPGQVKGVPLPLKPMSVEQLMQKAK